jgi:hypothetical protein
MVSESGICVVNLIVLQWLNGGMLSQTLFVGLLFVYRIFSSKMSWKVTDWRKRRIWGTHFKICHNLVTFFCNLSWLQIFLLAVIYHTLRRRTSRSTERPKIYPRSMSLRNFLDIDTVLGFKWAP